MDSNTATTKAVNWSGSAWLESTFNFDIKPTMPASSSPVLQQTKQQVAGFSTPQSLFNFKIVTDEKSTTNAINSIPETFTSINFQLNTTAQKSVTMDPMSEHMKLLGKTDLQQQPHEIATTPLFIMPVLEYAEQGRSIFGEKVFPQYGLLGAIVESEAGALKTSDHSLIDVLDDVSISEFEQDPQAKQDPRVFWNVAAPSSTFICGSQGSGKSHTLSCLLENCLVPCAANVLPNPLCGVVFHYDTFVSDSGGSPCEAVYLSSNRSIKVRVLCSPTNIQTMTRTYAKFPNVTVTPLEINETDLNTKRMMDMMAVSSDSGPVPLYLHTITRILRQMRISQQTDSTHFNYQEFKRLVATCDLTSMQLTPLHQRLDILESFMPRSQTTTTTTPSKPQRKKDRTPLRRGTDWTPTPSHLTIIDLSCPCITPAAACALFNTCLSIFLETRSPIGKVIALDEAHKYLSNPTSTSASASSSPEADTLTATLLSTIRLQRHQGARILISTQEPTISPALLDLSSVTIVHRFTSPGWLSTLSSHLAGAGKIQEASGADGGKKGVLQRIVELAVGEALIFAPSAMVGVEGGGGGGSSNDDVGGKGLEKRVPKRLGCGFLRVRVRQRVTDDGGKSVMAE